MTSYGVGDEGLEPLQQSNGNTTERVRSDVKSDASGDVLDDTGWAAIVEAWPMLSMEAQRAMVEFVERQLGVVVQAVESAEPTQPD